MKIRPMAAQLFHAGRQTDRQHGEANCGISQFRERAKKRGVNVASCDAAEGGKLRYGFGP